MLRFRCNRALTGIGLLMVAGLLPLTGTAAAEPYPERPVTQIIVKFKPLSGALPADANGNAYAMTSQRMASLNATSAVALSYQRPMSGNAHVVRLEHAMTIVEAAVVAAQLSQQAEVAYAEADAWMYPAAVPNDASYSSQWHYMDPDTSGYAGAANLPEAWDTTTGSAGIVVAVVDTGVLNHSDLQANLVSGSAAASGYDMISDSSAADSGEAFSNDGDARDADPTDPGSWVAASDPVCGTGSIQPSSWHGTHVAGTIGAVGNNGVGVAGVNWASKLLTVRVLGSCGGYLSDIVDGIAWAAGETVSGVPANANPAKVINLSLGGSGTCGTTNQTAIDAAVAGGATVVVAAGNSNDDVANYQPANCNNVITVAAVGPTGGRAYYSNYDTAADNLMALAAPGGDQSFGLAYGVYSTADGGTTTASNDNAYEYKQGTSMAAPHVSGIVALMLAANSKLTDGTIPVADVPALIKTKLKASVRTFPTGTGSDCTTSTCGAGIVDAAAAVQSVSTAPTANAGSDQSVNPAQTVNLSGAASTDDGSVTAYAWVQTDSGVAATLTGASTAIPSFTAPSTARTMTFELTVTDDVGLSATDSVNVSVVPPAPTSLAAAANGASQIDLTWSDNSSNEAGFKIERRVAGTGSYSLVGTVVADSTSYSDTTAAASTSYEYRTYAYYDAVNSSYSAVASATTADAPTSTSSGGGGGFGWLGVALLGLPLLRRVKRK